MRQLIARLMARLTTQRSVGQRGEDLAAAHLQRQGYRVMARNLRSRIGEIDLLAEAPDRRTVVIVEVKTAHAASPHFVPEMHVTRHKQRKLIALAVQIARKHRLADRPIRFDIIAVENIDHANPTVRHHQGAFTTDG